jgi:hypothetical protein
MTPSVKNFEQVAFQLQIRCIVTKADLLGGLSGNAADFFNMHLHASDHYFAEIIFFSAVLDTSFTRSKCLSLSFLITFIWCIQFLQTGI